MSQKSEYTEVPITRGFDNDKVIGWLKILTEELPPLPNFVFSLAYLIKENKFKPGDVPMSEYIGEYELITISPVLDDSYIGYLKQIGKI